MTTSQPAPNDDLFHALAARARATSDGRLVLAVVVGMAAAIGIAVWRPAGWLIVAGLALCAAAFGAWGIADRELSERSTKEGAPLALLRAVRVVCIVVGTCAVIAAALAGLGTVLGTWIS